MSDTFVGFDFGTKYARVAVHKQGRANVIANERGDRSTVCYVSYNEDQTAVGLSAQLQHMRKPKSSVHTVRPHLEQGAGSPHTFDVEYVKEDESTVSLKLTPEDVTATILSNLKETAETATSTTITNAVFTVPIRADSKLREGITAAAAKAGITVSRFVSAPVAAVMAYGIGQGKEGREEVENVLVVDWGASSLELAVVSVSGGMSKVVTSAVDAEVNGSLFDDALIKYLNQEFKKKHKADISGNKKAQNKLKMAVEVTKRALSSSASANCSVESLHEGLDFNMNVTRSRFDLMLGPIIRKAQGAIAAFLEANKIAANEITSVVLAGGCCRIPKVANLIVMSFEDAVVCSSITADEAACMGAAEQAAFMGSDVDVHATNAARTTLPATAADIRVALVSGHNFVMIPKGTPFPVKRSVDFFAAADATSAELVVVEGGATATSDNKKLCTLNVAVKDEDSITATFALDEAAVLTCSLQSGESQCTVVCK